MSTLAPAKRPCTSCPYRKDVPPGLWAAQEYEKLPAYDLPIHEQAMQGATGAFHCHQRDGRLCAGWVGVHGIETLGIRLVGQHMSYEDLRATANYDEWRDDVPLFRSGSEAALHGLSGVEDPGPKARKMIDRLTGKLGRTT